MSLPAGVLKKAIVAAQSSTYYPYKVGAVIFKANKIIADGENGIRFCQRIAKKFKKFENSLHAEQNAIIKAMNRGRNLSGYSMLVIRLNGSGNLSLGRPCEMCMNFIKFVGIKTIYYSDAHGQIIKEKIRKNKNNSK